MFKTLKGVISKEIRPDAGESQDTSFNTAISTLGHTNDNARYVTLDNSNNAVFNTSHTTYSNLDRISAGNTFDTSFRSNQGTGFSWLYPGTNDNNNMYCVSVQPSNSKILLGGDIYLSTPGYSTGLARLNSNLTEDTTFNTNIGIGTDGAASVKSAIELSTGKILIGGQFGAFDGNTSRSYVVRRNADGTEDTTWNTNTGTAASDYCPAVCELANGRLLIGGDLFSWNGTAVLGLINLAADGSYDATSATFTTNLGTGFTNGTYGGVNKVIELSNGKILVCGYFTTFNGNGLKGLALLNSDGTENTAFTTNMGTGFTRATAVEIVTIAVDVNGKIVCGGYFDTFNGNGVPYLARLNADGTEDTTFTTNIGTGPDGSVRTLTIDANDAILVGGEFVTFNGNTREYIIRLNDAGTEDGTFYTNIGPFNNGVMGSTLNGTDILIVGLFSSSDGTFVRNVMQADTDGVMDTAFNTAMSNTYINGTRPENEAVSVSFTIQADNDLLVKGYFDTFNGNARKCLVRLNNDGTEDTAFQTNLGTGFTSAGNLPEINVAVQQLMDTDILIGGLFDTFDGNTRNNLVRLNLDGTEDSGFYTNLGTGFDGAVGGLAIQPADDKIIVVGVFANLNATARNKIVRLNSSGTVDATFTTNIGTGPNGTYLSDVLVDNNNKILVWGDFTTWDGANADYIVRLNSDGTKDTTFNTAIGTGATGGGIYAVKVQNDDKIVISGEFTAFDSVSVPKIVRIADNGDLDTVFDTAIGTGIVTGGSFSSAIDETNGWIYVAGSLFDFNGISVGQIVKLYQSPGNPYEFIVPAGVTSVTVVPVNGSGISNCNPTVITVVPNTTYAVTISGSSYDLSSLNTLGAVYSWTGTGYLLISWAE